MYELAGTELKLNKEVEKKTSFKCGTFGASGLAERQLATGNFEGYLQLWDLEHTDKAGSIVYSSFVRSFFLSFVRSLIYPPHLSARVETHVLTEVFAVLNYTVRR